MVLVSVPAQRRDLLQEDMTPLTQVKFPQLTHFLCLFISPLLAKKPSLFLFVLDLPHFHSSPFACVSPCPEFPGLNGLQMAVFTLLLVFCQNVATVLYGTESTR